MFSDRVPAPSDPASRLNIGGIPWMASQAVPSLPAYAYQKAFLLVLAKLPSVSVN